MVHGTSSPLSRARSLPGTLPLTRATSLPPSHILSMASILFTTPPVTSSTVLPVLISSRVFLVTSGMSFASGLVLGSSV